jgi:hypothetical protein
LRARGELRALDGLGVLGPRKDLPSPTELRELDAVPLGIVMLAHLIERRAHGRRRGIRIQGRELVDGDRPVAGEERRLKQLR